MTESVQVFDAGRFLTSYLRTNYPSPRFFSTKKTDLSQDSILGQNGSQFIYRGKIDPPAPSVDFILIARDSDSLPQIIEDERDTRSSG